MSTTQDFTCVFCSETFEDKETLQEHFRKHGDPKFNNVTKNKSRFENEQNVGSEKSEENEMVGCDVCDEMFKSISKAITHKHKVHPDHDAKHFCPWCGKLFTMKHLYNKHMQSSHPTISYIEENRYHCDSCNVNFYVPSAMVYHNKFFHRQDTELPSIGHSKKVKTFNQEMVQIYYCPFCGEEYNNKVNLHKHMTDDHNDENQSPDEVLRCPLCDAVFYHLDAYELHLSFHSSDDIYSDDSDMALTVTDFSLESVPPIMEKVEEEIKTVENEGIDQYLQLVMDESRESGNIDGFEKSKSKKHKKHKKSKKAAITLDEFLNMNKDVFGDGLDVQGIEEIPTQQVLKKCKGKKDITKTIPASALAKLKKQGITVKSNSGPNSPTFQTNRNVTVNKANFVHSRVSVMSAEKTKAVTTSSELLSKLLNQGNNQIKIVKKSSAENLNKDKIYDQADPDIQAPASSNVKMSVSNNNLSTNNSDAEVTNGSNIHEMEQSKNVVQVNKVSNKNVPSFSEYSNETDMEVTTNLSSQDFSGTTVNNDDHIQAKTLNYEDHDHNIGKSEIARSTPEALENLQKKQHEADMHISNNNDSFETNGEDIETNTSDDEHNPSPTQDKNSKNLDEISPQEKYNNLQKSNNKPLDALKHLSGLITIKPAHSAEDKSDIMEADKLNEYKETDEIDTDMQLKVAKILGKNVQNISLKKPNIPKKRLATPTKSIDALKTLNKQLTITPSVTSTTKCNDESEDEESESHNFVDNLNVSNKNLCSESDNANFKTPISITKQLNLIAKSNHHLEVNAHVHTKNAPKGCFKEEDNTKNTFNMDILKRLTNVTAKPFARAANSTQLNSNQLVDSRMSVIQKIEKNKQIDQDIEIFNIDDSDSDQELPNDEFEHKEIVNTPMSSDTRTTPSKVLKNLSKNITIKPTNPHIKNVLNIKKEVLGDSPKQISDGDLPNSSNNESKNISQNKHMNIHLNHTLKKLGNNISIRSQYSSPDSHRYQMLHDEDIDDNFDMNEEGRDSENINQVKITEMQEDDEDIPSDTDTEYNENVIVQSPHASNSENEEETHNSQRDEEINDDIEKQIKTNTLSKENSASKCLDNFKRNNKELTIKSLTDKNTHLPSTDSTRKKQEEAIRVTNKVCKDMCVKQFRAAERQDDDNEISTKNVNQSAASSSSSQKVSNQVNTIKTVKTFQSETIIEEITTTVTKTIRTVNQSSKQVAKNANVSAYRPRLVVSNQQTKPLHGMTVRNAPTVGTKIRNAAPALRPTTVLPTKHPLVPVRPQNQIVPRQQGMFRANAPGPSNIKKNSPQPTVQKPVIGKPLKISPLAMSQTVKRVPENMTGHFGSFKKPKDSMIPSMDSCDDDNNDSMVNYSSASSCRSDFSTSATKIVKGKSVVTATQAKMEQHSEQHITKLNNMAGLKIVRTSAKQASQIETKNNMCAAKRTTMDAIEKLQKQGLLIKKPRIEPPEEDEHYNSGSEGDEENYEEND